MISTTTDSIVVEKGMRILVDALGVVDTERFLSIMNRDKKNYDEWRKEYFDKMTTEQYKSELRAFEAKES